MIDAQTIARDLGGVWRGNRGNAPCPVCQPERRHGQDALSLRDEGGRLLAFCHKRGCSFAEIARALGLHPDAFRPDAEAARAAEMPRAKDEAQREGRAKALWGDVETLLIIDTLAETYLRKRGITCPLPDTLRFQAMGWHPSGCRFPMMLARIDGGARFREKLAKLDVGVEARLALWHDRKRAHEAKKRVVCGAKTRKGNPCRNKSESGKRRCKFHGGMSTGPRTLEGRAKIAAAQRKRWAKFNCIE